MRQPRTILAFLSTILVFSSVEGTNLRAQDEDAKAQPTPIRVLYTGKLLGYYREPVGLTAKGAQPSQKDCLAAAKTNDEFLNAVRACDLAARRVLDDSLPRVGTFYDWQRYQKNKDMPAILLGMGDNFAPDLPARIRKECFVTTAAPGWKTLQFDWNRRGRFPLKSIPVGQDCAPLTRGSAKDDVPYIDTVHLTFAAEDNVANFFMRAGYDAVVPGREDFLYGAPWLHKVAVAISAQSIVIDKHHTPATPAGQPQNTQILAANLHYVYSKDKVEADNITPTQSPCPLFLAAIDPGTTQTAVKCDTRLPALPANQEGVGYKLIYLHDTQGRPVTVLVVGVVSNDFLREISDSNQKFRVTGFKAPKNPAKAGALESQEATFQLVVTNPVSEVEKILEYVERDCKNKGIEINRRILMAQMSRAEALEFSSAYGASGHLRINGTDVTPVGAAPPEESGFDLIVSEADQFNATQNEEAVYGHRNDLRIDPNLPQAVKRLLLGDDGLPDRQQANNQVPDKIRAYLVTPRPAYDPNANKLISPMNVVTIDNPSSFDSAPALRFHNDAYAFDLKDDGISLFPVADNSDGNQAYVTARIKDQITRLLAAEAGANLALIQDRDLFDRVVKSEANFNEVCGLENRDLRCVSQAREEIFLWKHDEFVMLDLSGSQLSTILTNSQYLADLETRGLQGDATGEWVRTFGIVQAQTDHQYGTTDRFDVPGISQCQATQAAFPGTTSPPPTPPAPGPQPTPITYCVDGTPIQPSRIYSVVTTRALASNNELFAGINPPAAGTAKPLNESDQIFGVLASAITPERPGAPGMPTPNITGPQPQAFVRANSRFEQRGRWHLNIPTWTASYTEYNPNNADASLSSLYGAATDTRASSPHSSDFEASQNVRFLHEGKYLDYGPAFMMNVSKKVTGGATGDTINYGSNSIEPEWITEFNIGRPFFKPRTAEPTKLLPQLRLASTLIYQTQMFGPLLPVGCDNPAGGCKVQLVVDRQRAFIPRFGLREDLANDSYAEFGYEYGLNAHVLQQVAIVNGGVTTDICDLAPQTLSQCVTGYQKPADGSTPPSPIITATTDLNGSYRRRQSQGFYVDSQMTVTLSEWSQQKLKLYTKFQGDFWGSRNILSQSTVQTKYDFVTAVGLQVPIRGNLSLMPAYQVFYYENMNIYKPLVAKTINLSVTWTFDWHAPVNIVTNSTYLTPQGGGGASAPQNPLLPAGTVVPGGSPLPK
ncbi:MAG: hypothetical protein WDN23_04640 [Edaphobacter sp.]